jgi:hypothetical protein
MLRSEDLLLTDCHEIPYQIGQAGVVEHWQVVQVSIVLLRIRSLYHKFCNRMSASPLTHFSL